ncbi:hypothetical protein SASPL_106542 [Salvia splendens]|uniref:Uncharacterized protein n=1 Tax=Salvia splendens TaxID=180675 RepID=A0A8X8YSN6_SALSN|nr:hypothetical protein SASPL_106542 [Salvia splendens]
MASLVSDSLYFDDFIPPLSPADRLDAAQIYFALPAAMKASAAMDQIGRRKKKARISPAEEDDPQSNHSVTYRKSFGGGGGKTAAAVSRSGSLRKLGRYSSRRAMQAVRSFKNKLSTINEA